MMKKTVLLALCSVLILALTACGQAAKEKKGDAMSLEEIFTAIQTDVDNLPEVAYTKLNADNYNYYLFIDPVEGAEALAGDAAINAIPHSAVLLRVPDAADAVSIAKNIEDNANLNKWICVGAEKKIVKVHNSTILLIMSASDTADSIAANFDKLWE
ncbi:MAG: hypothetical protein KBI01_04365 [Oscillospiraceae bacterium]|nr:hypothetical protein [Oscillospiraceae bacterium]